MGSLQREPYIDRCREALKKAPGADRKAEHGGWRDPWSFAYLCGTQRLARWVEESIAQRSGGAALTGNVLTLDGLLERYCSASELMPATEVRLRVWADLRRPGPWKARGATLSFVSEIVELYDLLRTEGRAPDRILEDPAAGPLLASVVHCLDTLREEGKFDRAGLLQDLPRRIREHPPRLQCLVVDGFEGYPPLLASIVEELASSSEETHIVCEGETLFPPNWTVESAVNPLGRGGSPAASPDAPPSAVPGASLEAWVSLEEPPEGPRPLPQVRLVRSIGGEREEVEAIAREVRGILDRSPEERVVVALPSLPSYAPRIREVFPRFCLRPEVLVPGSLLGSPGAQPVRRLLDLLTQGVPRAGLLDLLADLAQRGQLGRFFPPSLGLAEIDTITRKARCLEGTAAFTRQLREYGEHLPEGAPPSDTTTADAVAEGLGGLFQVLEPLEKGGPPTEFVANLRNVVMALGYGDPAEAFELRETFEALVAAARAVGGRGEGGAWLLSELRHLVESALALTQATERQRNPGILITGLHDAGLVDSDHIVLGGLSERNLPSDRPSPLLPSTARARWGLPSGEALVHRERIRLARVLARARRGVVLTCPSRTGEEEVLPSPLLNDLLAVARPVEGPSRGEAETRLSLADAMVGVARELASPAGLSASSEALVRTELAGPRGSSWRSMLQGMKAERQRRSAPRSTAFDGPCGSGAARQLARRRFPEGRFTVHEVQDYLRCPYRFYLEKVLRIQGPEEVTDDVDRPALGMEVHRLLFQLLDGMRDASGAIVPLDPGLMRERTPAVLSSLSDFLRSVRPRSPEVEVAARRLLGPPSRPEDGALHTALLRLLEDTAQVRAAHVEVPFDDRPPHDPESVDRLLALPPLPLHDVEGLQPQLVGRIDRIGFGRSSVGGLVIDDYKTGRSRPKDQERARDEVPAGLDLQLPLYMAAALHGLRGRDPSLFPLGMRFLWISSSSETAFVPFLRLPEGEKLASRQRERGVAMVDLALRHASNAARGILEGRFPINGPFASSDDRCRFAAYCDHARGCRFEADRIFSGAGG